MTELAIDSNIDKIADRIMEFAHSTDFALNGPADIEYGFGWEPTLSFWYEERRIHIYWDWSWKEGDGLTVEMGEENVQPSVLLGMVYTYDELWEIFEKFLKEKYTFIDLPDFGWKEDSRDHNKFIPHPPSQAGFNSGNIASFVEQAKTQGQLWQPNTPKSKIMEFIGRWWSNKND